MSTFKKLVRKFIEEPHKIKIPDIERLLGELGYEERRNPGSERIFHKKGANPITVPTVSGRAVKVMYVKRIAKILYLEDLLDKFTES